MTGRKMLLLLPLALALTLLTAPTAKAKDQSVRLSIVVDKSCLIQPESDPLVLGDHTDAFRDDAICHLESVLSSHHIEEKITAGERSRFFVRVAEQEYVVQNPTDQPALFTIRVHVPENWSIDSDPQPTSLKDVHYIDSSGIRALVSVHMAAGKAQSVLELTNLQPRIRDLFELTRLTTVFENHGGYRGLSQD